MKLPSHFLTGALKAKFFRDILTWRLIIIAFSCRNLEEQLEQELENENTDQEDTENDNNDENDDENEEEEENPSKEDPSKAE